MLRDLNLPVAYPNRTFATVDHIVPTDQHQEPLQIHWPMRESRKN